MQGPAQLERLDPLGVLELTLVPFMPEAQDDRDQNERKGHRGEREEHRIDHGQRVLSLACERVVNRRRSVVIPFLPC